MCAGSLGDASVAASQLSLSPRSAQSGGAPAAMHGGRGKPAGGHHETFGATFGPNHSLFRRLPLEAGWRCARSELEPTENLARQGNEVQSLQHESPASLGQMSRCVPLREYPSAAFVNYRGTCRCNHSNKALKRATATPRPFDQLLNIDQCSISRCNACNIKTKAVHSD